MFMRAEYVHVVAKTCLTGVNVKYTRPDASALHRKLAKDRACYQKLPVAHCRRIDVSCARDSNPENRMWHVRVVDAVFDASSDLHKVECNGECNGNGGVHVPVAARQDRVSPRLVALGTPPLWGLLDLRVLPAKMWLSYAREALPPLPQLPQAASSCVLVVVRQVLTEAGRSCFEPADPNVDIATVLENLKCPREPAAVRDFDTLDVSGRPDAYAAICADGFPLVGRYIEAGQVILGRVREVNTIDDAGIVTTGYRCCSVVSDKSGVLVDIQQKTNKDTAVVIFRLHSCHLPSLGDKLCSRHGQKGVVGRLERRYNLPFGVVSGTPATIYLNPCCIPSRMTVGHLKESSTGKLALAKGLHVTDGTPFLRTLTMEQLREDMEQHGETHGRENYAIGLSGVSCRCVGACCKHLRPEGYGSCPAHHPLPSGMWLFAVACVVVLLAWSCCLCGRVA